MQSFRLIAVLAVVSALVLSSPGLWAGTKTIGFVPDPSCRSSKLVVPVEQTLADNLHAPGLKILRKKPEGARFLLQYFVSTHREGDRILVQLDGQVFGNRNGKLYAEGSVRSEAFDDDENGRTQAARQAGRRLGQHLSDSLAETLARPGRARRVMLQVSLEGSAVPAKDAVMGKLKRGLSDMSLRQRGSTDRNLMLVIFTTENHKDLSELIEKALEGEPRVQWTWVVQSRNTLMLNLRGADR